MAAEELSFVPLRGLERLFSLPTPNCVYRICDSFLIEVESAASLIVRHGRAAAAAVATRHPKMRATVWTEQSLKASAVSHPGAPAPPYFAIASPAAFAHDNTALDKMFSVEENASRDPRAWERVVQTLVNEPSNLIELPLWRFILVLNANAEGTHAHLIVVAEHVAADGFSTSRAAHDFFTAVSNAACGNAALLLEPAVLAPLPPGMDLMRDSSDNKVPWLARALQTPLIKVAAAITMSAYKNHPAVIPLLPEVAALKVKEPLPLSPSAVLFADGSAANCIANKRACKEQGVTLHGALVACLLAAYSRVAKRAPASTGLLSRLVGRGSSGASSARVAVNMDVDFNLRKRLTPSLGDDHVGLLINWGRLESLAPDNKGVSLDEPFWDVARRAKADTESMLGSFQAWFAPMFYEQRYTSPSDVVSLLGGEGVARGGVLSDMNVSNIGPYPFATRHALGDAGSGAGLRILSHHLVNGASPISNNAIWFFSSVEGRAGYSLCYKSEHEVTRRIFADVVNAAEKVASIGAGETLGQVADRLCTYGKAGLGSPSVDLDSSGAAAGAADPPYKSVYEDRPVAAALTSCS